MEAPFGIESAPEPQPESPIENLIFGTPANPSMATVTSNNYTVASIEINPCVEDVTPGPTRCLLPDETDPLLVTEEELAEREYAKDLARRRAERDAQDYQLRGEAMEFLNEQIAKERQQEVKRIEEDVEHVAETMQLIRQQVDHQGRSLDDSARLLEDATENTEQTVILLDSAEQKGSRWRTVKMVGWGLLAAAGAGAAIAIALVRPGAPRPPLGGNGNNNNAPPPN